MAVAWLVTLPLAGIAGAACWALAHAIGGLPGVLVVLAVLIALSGYMYLRSRRTPVDAGNVNDEWAEPGPPVVLLKDPGDPVAAPETYGGQGGRHRAPEPEHDSAAPADPSPSSDPKSAGRA